MSLSSRRLKPAKDSPSIGKAALPLRPIENRFVIGKKLSQGQEIGFNDRGIDVLG
jgi:hypothetical protein